MESFPTVEPTTTLVPTLDQLLPQRPGVVVARCDWDTACEACEAAIPVGQLVVNATTIPPVYISLCGRCATGQGVVVDVDAPIGYELTARGRTALVEV